MVYLTNVGVYTCNTKPLNLASAFWFVERISVIVVIRGGHDRNITAQFI